MDGRPERHLVDAALARARLGEPWDPRGALADDAVWLALMALGGRARPELARLVEAKADGVTRERVALALLLRGVAADKETGAAERALAALACVALGCADAEVGRVLQQGFSQLDLLDIVKQIPVAARVRTLTLEFRFRSLGALPARFVGRVQDLLERLDREALTAVSLRDRASPRDRDLALRVAALSGGDARRQSLLRALLEAGAPLDGPALHAACVEGAPRSWPAGAAGRRAVLATYRALAAELAGGPWALLPARGRRYGLAPGAQARPYQGT